LEGEHLGPPGPGRVFSAHRLVRLSDVDPEGHVRLDAVARYLQDVATDDVRQTGLEGAIAWVVRRTTLVSAIRPRYGERLELATWCSGTGPALAERRTTIRGEWGSSVEAVALWVSLDRRTLRPTPIADEHFEPYRQQAGGRRVRGRFRLPAEPPDGASRRPWPLRHADFDLYRHVNNVVAWTAIEEEVNRSQPGAIFEWGQVEYRRPIDPGEALLVRVAPEPEEDCCGAWLTDSDGVAAVAGRLGRGRLGWDGSGGPV
jgi:acyl-ACP thioesterase